MDETIEVILQKKKIDSKLGIQFVNRNDCVVVHAATSPEVQKVLSPPVRIHAVNGIQAHSSLQVATIIRDAQPGDVKIVVDNIPEVVNSKPPANGNRHQQINTAPSRREIMRSRTKKMLSLKKTNSSLRGFFSSSLKSVRHIVRGKKDKKRKSAFLNRDGVVSSDSNLEKYPENQKSMDEAGSENPSLPIESSLRSQQSPKTNGMAESRVSLEGSHREQAALPDIESDDFDIDSSDILNRVNFDAPNNAAAERKRLSLQDADLGQSRESLGYGYEPIELSTSNSRNRRAGFKQMPRSSSAHSFGSNRFAYLEEEQRSSSSFVMRGPIQSMPGLASLEMKEFVKSQRIKDWVRQFRRSDPRYQIHHFFNDVAQVGTNNMDEFNPILVSPLLRAFYKSSVFTVWRPTSFDAIRRMMLHEGVGKGLDIKGKSAKKGKLSGFVPFLQIHKEEHKKDIRTHPKDARIRVFYNQKASRDIVVDKLREVCKEMIETLQKAQEIVASSEEEEIDDDTMEWALEKLIWAMTDPTVNCLDDYAPKQFGIDVPVRLFWEAIILRQDISREPGTENDVGRPSEPNFQNMNNLSLRKEPTNGGPKTVLMHYADPNDKDVNPLNPLDFVMAYEENNGVMPVVSDFDCFLVGTRGVEYEDPLPDEQLKVLQWCVKQIEAVLENGEQDKSWTGTWLNILKTEAAKGFHPETPPLGFSDPKTYTIMKQAIHRLREEGSVRHGAECFNFYFPQELDDHFLVISDNLPGTTLPWKYVDPKGLQDILKTKIDEGYAFPLNPKWVLCDDGWKSVYDSLMNSQKANVQDALAMWYPPESGIREKIESIHQNYPSGFNPTHSKMVNADHDGTAAMDLAEQELRYYLTFQRAKRKLRGMLIWKRILDEHRQEAKAKREARERAALSAEGETADASTGVDDQTPAMES
mmetsp:Transcript_34489/g.83672  ORF Transcript_34489/g.83672 Transcript_34489/m.83672 type:complete len:923 (+) Transcript_34489:297-3065(+)|eukprot:CAMPEP_0113609720 /NCGR_PEP_ID=MMETSP0017_2-20120614/4645_1 /TAXON_ID=2856 /ORGANISM="Cylindrotheca closterium" /LENGTH=922 /DNA_ID=CAMNT_0000518563 /DNA_START=284 /DNA_END=3052 /DNA_ORIENTATION=+ /assembly_acc=CAM_ASM_000147